MTYIIVLFNLLCLFGVIYATKVIARRKTIYIATFITINAILLLLSINVIGPEKNLAPAQKQKVFVPKPVEEIQRIETKTPAEIWEERKEENRRQNRETVNSIGQ